MTASQLKALAFAVAFLTLLPFTAVPGIQSPVLRALAHAGGVLAFILSHPLDG